jgi:hypothetical protein
MDIGKKILCEIMKHKPIQQSNNLQSPRDLEGILSNAF